MKIPSYSQYFFVRSISFIFCLIIFGFMAVSSAHASSFILQPSVIPVQAGRTFSLPVVIDPAGVRQYTVRLSLTFPPSQLEVVSFTFAGNWMGVSQPGYDSLSNTRGELIKTGGFPRGFVSPVSFGTITFRAKTAGESIITVGSQSFILNRESKSTMESRPQVRIIATATGAPGASSGEPLPSLPPGEGNIFDISLSPLETASRPGMVFLALLLALAVFLGIIGRIIVVRIRRRALMQKIKNDTDFKS